MPGYVQASAMVSEKQTTLAKIHQKKKKHNARLPTSHASWHM
jgi:hypothetical protein